MSIEHSKMNIASITTLGLMTLILCIFTYMSFFPIRVFELVEDPIVIGETFKRGDPLPIEFCYCKNKDVKGSLNVQFVDGIIFTAPEITGNLEIGCHTVKSYSQIVPNTLPVGEYYLKLTFSNRVNMFRTIQKTYETKTFNVVE